MWETRERPRDHGDPAQSGKREKPNPRAERKKGGGGKGKKRAENRPEEARERERQRSARQKIQRRPCGFLSCEPPAVDGVRTRTTPGRAKWGASEKRERRSGEILTVHRTRYGDQTARIGAACQAVRFGLPLVKRKQDIRPGLATTTGGGP